MNVTRSRWREMPLLEGPKAGAGLSLESSCLPGWARHSLLVNKSVIWKDSQRPGWWTPGRHQRLELEHLQRLQRGRCPKSYSARSVDVHTLGGSRGLQPGEVHPRENAPLGASGSHRAHLQPGWVPWAPEVGLYSVCSRVNSRLQGTPNAGWSHPFTWEMIISIIINIEQNPLHFQPGLGHLLHKDWQSQHSCQLGAEASSSCSSPSTSPNNCFALHLMGNATALQSS